MYLNEEYIKRNDLKIPLIVWSRRSSVFLRSQTTPYKWYILASRWHDPDNHPGFYDIALNSVLHDGYEDGVLLQNIDKFEKCHSDQYEKQMLHMVNFCKLSGLKAIEGKDHTMAAWQIFLMMYDSWMADHMDGDFFKLVGLSLDSKATRKSRMSAINQAINKVDKRGKDVWVYTMLPLVQDYSDWLVKLIND
jgi:hypothetical protein